MKQTQDENKLPECLERFPSDTNVRLVVTGLAYCKLRKGESSIHFLRHVKGHRLRLTIYRRRKDERPAIYCQPIEIAAGEQVRVATSARPPEYISAEIDNGEHRLNELINLQFYQSDALTEIAPSTGPAPSRLEVGNFRYYTPELMTADHTLFRENTVLAKRKFGYSLGGKLQLENSDWVSIEIGNQKPFKLPRTAADSKNYYYDLYFSNHCEPQPGFDCKPEEEAEEELDFRFYRDVLAGSDGASLKFRLENDMHGHLRVGACNVAVVAPVFDPPGSV